MIVKWSDLLSNPGSGRIAYLDPEAAFIEMGLHYSLCLTI